MCSSYFIMNIKWLHMLKILAVIYIFAETEEVLIASNEPNFRLKSARNSQVLRKELEQCLIPTLIFMLNPRIVQVASRSHPPMDLIPKRLHVFLPL